jgi:hypothetical protein
MYSTCPNIAVESYTLLLAEEGGDIGSQEAVCFGTRLKDGVIWKVFQSRCCEKKQQRQAGGTDSYLFILPLFNEANQLGTNYFQ